MTSQPEPNTTPNPPSPAAAPAPVPEQVASNPATAAGACVGSVTDGGSDPCGGGVKPDKSAPILDDGGSDVDGGGVKPDKGI